MTIEDQIAEAVERGVARGLAGGEERIVRRVVAEISRRWPLPDGYSTRAELAEQLGIAIDTLDRKIAAGDPTIEVVRIGRAVRCRLRPPVTQAEIEKMAREAISS